MSTIVQRCHRTRGFFFFIENKRKKMKTNLIAINVNLNRNIERYIELNFELMLLDEISKLNDFHDA